MQLFYREKGSALHPPLIILHGLWGASDNWLPVADLLSQHFHVYLPDLRNHGNSPHSASFSYPLLSRDTEELIRQLNLPRHPFLVGHSLGGKALMHLLLRCPGIAEKAAVIDIGPQAYAPDTHASRHLRLAEYICHTPLSHICRRQEIHQAARAYFDTEEEIQIILKNIRKTATGYTWKVNAQAILENLPHLMDWELPEFCSPYPAGILFVKAGNSGYLPARINASTRCWFPQARQITIPEASHRIHADQPARLAHALSDFFLTP